MTSPASIFHSDKGGEYVGDAVRRGLRALGVTQSMGRVGSALDNAAAESFNSTLEFELLPRRRFATKDQARREVAAFIDLYNHRRRHSSCEMLPPVDYEQILAERAAERRPTATGRRETGLSDRRCALGTTRWHQGAGEWEAPSAISSPPRNGGKPTSSSTPPAATNPASTSSKPEPRGFGPCQCLATSQSCRRGDVNP